MLIGKEKYINAKNGDGISPLELANKLQKTFMVKQLL